MKLEDRLDKIETICDLSRNVAVATDLITSLCGEHLATGAFREVYNYNLDHRYVVKIEPCNSNCNIVEYMIWDEVKGLINNSEWVKKWFAPVKWISPNGRILVMQKTKVNHKKKKPEKIPAFLWDIKEENFGWIGNDFVCHDYGQFYNMIHYPKKMVKAKW